MIDINGRFGVTLRCLKDGSTKTIHGKNTVVNLGLLQVKRWLDRNEIVSAVPNYNAWRDGILCAGEFRRVTVLPKTSITGSNCNQPNFPPSYMLDGYANTQLQKWIDRDTWNNYFYISFAECLNIKGIGFVTQGDINSNWDGHTLTQIGFKYEGFTVAGAGNTAYNSVEYLRYPVGEWNGFPAYKMENQSYYLFVNAAGTKWVLSTSLDGTPAYETNNASLPSKPSLGTWVVGNGTPVAPTVTAGTSALRFPAFTTNGVIPTGSGGLRSTFSLFNDSTMYRVWDDYNSASYNGRQKYHLMTFESVRGLNNGANNHGWYGFLPYVSYFQIGAYCDDWYDQTWHVPEMHVYEAVMHPQNPYALKLGTGGSATTQEQTGLETPASGMEWKCDAVQQLARPDPSDPFKVRFSRYLDTDTANGPMFSEVGLFGNMDGHLPGKMLEPLLANASGLFGRALFEEPWDKTADDDATIFYEITVN